MKKQHVFRKRTFDFGDGPIVVRLIRYMGRFAWIDKDGEARLPECDTIRDAERQISTKGSI